MKKRVLAMIFAAFMALSLTACGGDSSASGTDSASEGAPAESQQEETPEEPSEPEPTDSGAVDDYDVTIGDCTFGTDLDGNKIIVVNYGFTNNSDETIAPFVAVTMNAFQDGVQLDMAIVADASVYDASIGQKQLKPGASLTGCQNAYVLSSESPVEIEVGPFIGNPVLFKTFEVQ